MKAIYLIVILPILAMADAQSVTSNVSRIKAWTREDVYFNPSTGAFSNTNFPSLAESAALVDVAERLPGLYDFAVAAMETNLTPLRARLDEARNRRVASLELAVSPENALDRRNLTMCVMSNGITRVGEKLHLSMLVFGNAVMKSDPVMSAGLSTEMGKEYAAFDCEWTEYGTNGVTVVHKGEEYECFELGCDIPTNAIPAGATLYVRPWVIIGDLENGFSYGNRQLRCNGEMMMTTNDASFLGTFSTTNGVSISDGFIPWIDRGDFQFRSKEDE